MSDRSSPEEIRGVVWAIVLVQGGLTLITLMEGLAGSAFIGSLGAVLPVHLLTFFGAVIALVASRGLRLGRTWARRVTVVAEWLILGFGTLTMVASTLLAGTTGGLAAMATTIAAPAAVLILIYRNPAVFSSPAVR